MDPVSQIIKAFNLTVHPSKTEDIKEAENFLDQKKLENGFAITLMLIIDNKENPIDIRQAAAVNLKNFVQKHWREKKSVENFIISQEDKLNLKNNVLDAIIRAADENKISVIYEEILFRIIEYDYPKDMPGFVEKILSKLNSSGDSFNIIQGCMIAIKSLVANYEFMLDEDRKPLNIIVPSLFSYLEKYAASILEKYNEQSAITMNVILKTFHASIHLDLPTYFVNEANLHRWMVFVKTILDSPIPPNLESPTQDDEECQIREKNVLWQNKKWCGRVLQRFIQKYGNPKFENKENKGLATLFEEKYSVSFLETFVAILFKRKSLFVSRKLLHFSLKYVFYALRLAKTWVTIHPHLEKIMFEVLMPMLYLTPKDESLWNNDPDEYVRKEDDFTQISNNNKNASMDLIEAICKKQDINNQPYLHLFFRYAAFCMINNQDPRTKQPLDLLLKEALLWALGILKDDIVNDEALKAQMETILEQYVLPEFKNQIGFLRARACWIFGKYGHIEFQNPQNIKIAVEGISHCLMDTQLPVRVKAAVALNCLLTQKEAEDLLRPSLPKILEIYLKLMDQIDNEGIVAALEGIVDSYQQEIVPYAFDLVVHLTSAFHKYCQKSNKQAANTNNDDEDDSEAEMAAAGCLEAIRRILLAKLPEITYTSLQQVLVPIFNYCFSEDGSDFIDEALSCLNILLYNSQTLSNIILFYYPILIYIIVGLPENINIQALTHLNEEQKDLLEKVKSGWGAEFLEAMLGCFKNYISKTKESFLTMNDLFGVSFINLLFKAINRVYEISLNGSDDLDMVLSTTLNITLIENNLGKIDNILPYILDTAIERIIKIEKSKQLKVVNFEVISLCLWYNPWITLTYLSSKNYVVPLFTNWFALLPQFKNDFDKIRVMFGLSSIFQMKENELPPEIISSCSGLIKQIVKLTSEILELREKEESFNSKDEAEEEGMQKKGGENEKDNEDDEDDEDEDDEDYDATERANLLYESPLETVDEILYFRDILEKLMKNQPNFYNNLLGSLDQNEKAILSKNFETAQNQYTEYLKVKAEEQQASKK